MTALNSIDANSWKGIEMAVKDMSEGKDKFPDNHQQDISPDVMDMLTAQVQRMVDESGNPTGFDARSWLSDWLRTPVPALDNRLPIEYLGNAEGIDLISRILASAQTGAYW
ncbi:antitoxin Xre/MbcA/ParS toxin-binding domain-containing protein [Burkholderia orbicola]|uniref:antitoxin Xre/MbcA/ParS toxin-binding domain-containing protein n=1 Tax=Burkholderia orbicola TaxID=2978683 RepID=UPI0039A414BB